jgi:hypothetical protein
MLPGVEPLEGIAEADRHLGRRVPLPTVPLPLARWVEVTLSAPGAVEVSWNLDDTRPGTPGRLSLYAGTTAPEAHELQDATAIEPVGDGLAHRSAPLSEAQESLRPVHELTWEHDGLHLRLTAQGPWDVEELVSIARSVG